MTDMKSKNNEIDIFSIIKEEETAPTAILTIDWDLVNR